jgi:hypothetical protein
MINSCFSVIYEPFIEVMLEKAGLREEARSEKNDSFV